MRGVKASFIEDSSRALFCCHFARLLCTVDGMNNFAGYRAATPHSTF